MSTCIRAGVVYKRHHWQADRCTKCGQAQSRIIFSSELPEGPKASVSSEAA